jgi:hypothetical protein
VPLLYVLGLAPIILGFVFLNAWQRRRPSGAATQTI